MINVATGEETKDQTVKIQGRRIVSIARSQESDATLPGSVDGQGEFLIPGLWDMHVHVHDKDELPLYVANGVTGIRVMSGEKDTVAFRIELARETPSPEIYLASAIVDGSPPVWPGSWSREQPPPKQSLTGHPRGPRIEGGWFKGSCALRPTAR